MTRWTADDSRREDELVRAARKEHRRLNPKPPSGRKGLTGEHVLSRLTDEEVARRKAVARYLKKGHE